jgi:putative ABC transport system permease protein
MHEFARDLRLAARGAVRRPGHSLAVIATLAIGIGANTAIYSMFNWLLFRPVPGVHKPDQLVTIRFQYPQSPARMYVSYRDYADLRDGVAAFSGLAASSAQTVNVATAEGDPQRIEAELVTTNYFSVLGAHPATGRDFAPEEEQPGNGSPTAIISQSLAQRLFRSGPAALGRSMTINGHGFTIVGIAPAGFRGRSLIASSEIWMPFGVHLQVLANASGMQTNRRRSIFIDAIGRLKPGETLEHANAQASATAASVPDFGGRTPGKRGSLLPTLYLGLGHDTYALDRLVTIFRLLMGSVALVLLLACANAANLLLARATSRRREIAVCQAIGASRFRIVRQQLAEGIVLSFGGGIAGLFFALWLTSLFDGMRILSYLPAVTGVSIDWRVCAFTFAMAVGTGVLFAVVPALATSRLDLQSSLKDGLTSSRHGRPLLRGGLVTFQIAVSVLLLAGAGLFVATLNNLRAVDLGLDPIGVVSFWVDPAPQGYTPERTHAYFRDVLARLRAVPGVQAAALSWTTPYAPMRSELPFVRPESPEARLDAASNTVSADYFATMRIPLVGGREFSDADSSSDTDKSGVAILSEQLARKAFPRGDALGSHVTLAYPKEKSVEIVGIVGDVRGRPVTADPEPFIYVPTRFVGWGAVHVRSVLPFAQTAAAIRDVTRAIDPALPPYDLEPFGAGIERTISEQRLFARLSGLFASAAALLAAVGVYGVMATIVGERSREFGIRLALGARTATLLALVMGRAVLIAGIGIIAGVLGAFALGRALESRLFGVSGADPTTIAIACGTVLSLALAASLVPAIRAARIDPVTSLRSE